MMKRILLILAIGVSLAPGAFADTGLLGYHVCPASNGENSQCQLDASIGEGATQCDRQKALESWVAESKADGVDVSGSAGL